MTTGNCKTVISKVFTFSQYKGGSHITDGWMETDGDCSFAESLSPMNLMIEAFKYRPLGTKIKVTMEEVD
jgi:hypothetical protein